MATKLTKKQKIFANAYIDTGNGTQSALKAYDTTDDNTANVIAVENLRKPMVMEYIQNHAQEAASMIYTLSQKSEQDNIRLSASKDILDRAGYGAVAKSESKTLNIDIKIDDSEKETLRLEYEEKLKAKLIQ